MFSLGEPGTCEKIGKFQCNNGKCIWKSQICDFIDHCGDNSDESSTNGAFCGMLPDSFLPSTEILTLRKFNLLGFIKLYQNKHELVKSGFDKKVKEG